MGDVAEGQGAYAVGIPSIDALHVELEERLASLIRAGDDAQDELAALQDHLQRHFAHEESLMSGTEFPMADCHAREHASVIDVVSEVQRLLAAGDVARSLAWRRQCSNGSPCTRPAWMRLWRAT